MTELEMVRQHLATPISDDELDDLRRVLGEQTWDRHSAAGQASPTERASAGLPGSRRYVEPTPPRPSPSWLRPVVLVAAAAVVLVLVVAGTRSLGRIEGTPVVGPTEEGVEEAIPRLLGVDVQLRWPDVAWDASPTEKEAFESNYRPQMDRLLDESFSTTAIEQRRTYAEISLKRALNGPQPIVDDTEIVVTSIDDVDVDGSHAVAVVTYRERIHVLRDPNPPGQLGSFVTGPDGWWEGTDEARITLSWEEGWKIDSVATLKPGG